MRGSAWQAQTPSQWWSPAACEASSGPRFGGTPLAARCRIARDAQLVAASL